MRIYSELSTKNGDLRVERVMQMRSGRGYVDSKPPKDGKLCKSGIASRAFKIWWWLDQLVCWDEQCQNLLEMESLKMKVSGTWILFFHILGIIIPTDELIFFRGVGIPPTSSDCMFFLMFRSPMIHQSLDLMKLGNYYKAWLLGFIFIQLSTMVGTPPWSTQFWWWRWWWLRYDDDSLSLVLQWVSNIRI